MFQGLAASGDNFTAIIMAAMAANMVRALQLATVAAFRMRFVRQRFVATTHSTP
jgi:hypothetical protein